MHFWIILSLSTKPCNAPKYTLQSERPIWKQCITQRQCIHTVCCYSCGVPSISPLSSPLLQLVNKMPKAWMKAGCNPQRKLTSERKGAIRMWQSFRPSASSVPPELWLWRVPHRKHTQLCKGSGSGHGRNVVHPLNDTQPRAPTARSCPLSHTHIHTALKLTILNLHPDLKSLKKWTFNILYSWSNTSAKLKSDGLCYTKLLKTRSWDWGCWPCFNQW